MKIAIPQMGNYDIPGTYLFKKILNAEIIKTPKMSKKTIELGNRYSPEQVCMPFKYTLGSFIESLEMGADILIQLGGGCRYGYYYELQEKILKDLGYNFTYINLITKGKTDFKKIIFNLKKINPKLNYIKLIYYFLITKKMVKYMDNMEDYLRKNEAFDDSKQLKNLYKKFLKTFDNTNYLKLKYSYYKYINKMKKVKLNNKNRIKIGIIGELYTVMEPFSNYNIEELLIKRNVSITRFTNASYLLFQKKKKMDKELKNNKYIKYKMGADASDNIIRTEYLCKNGYDAIIHIKSPFCTPEIGAMPIIEKICNEYNVPVLFFSFDSESSTTGLNTRLEALLDMIEMRKKNG